MAGYVAWAGGTLRTRTSIQNPKYPEGVRGLSVSAIGLKLLR